MDTVAADPNAGKPHHCLNPSRKVRIVGKIRGLTHREYESLTQDPNPWITIKNPEENGSSEKCKVLFETQSNRLSNSGIQKRETPASNLRKDGYELDYCYDQCEETNKIYSREIQPLVLELFEGRNSSVIALGAKGSGKTYTIQGSQEKPGLAVMAMSEIIAKAKELGKSVFVSLYEVTQEHAKDLLNPNHPDIQILDVRQGKVIIKGLSKVPVNSMTEFNDMYFSRGSSQSTQKVAIDQSHHKGSSQSTQKVATDQSHHKGLMVHISDDAKLANKINFVDLAGYEDPRKSSREGITTFENNRKNKSLYALLKVVSALNANDQWVPYRESKLTRLLQDSLGGRSHVLLLTCLNPIFCQDSLSSISLVSQSCRSIQQVLTDSTNRSQSSTKLKVPPLLKSEKTMSASLSDSTNKGQSSAKVKVLPSLKSEKTLSTSLSDLTYRSQSSTKGKVLPSFKSAKTTSASLSAKKHTGHSRLLSTTKDSRSLKGRNLFDEVKKDKVNSMKFTTPSNIDHLKLMQLRCQSEDTSCNESKVIPSPSLVVATFSLEEAPQDKYISECSSSVEVIEDVKSEAPGPQSVSKCENTPSAISDDPAILMKMDSKIYEFEGTLGDISDAEVHIQSEAASTCEEIKYLYKKGEASPLLSERIQEICNNLKALCESTPSVIKMPEEIATPCNNQVCYENNLEPKTPAMEPSSERYCTPSSKLKHTIVKDYLRFLNSANKEELKSLKGIGEKRATYILEMRKESPEPFKSLDDLQDIGLSAKQIKGMIKQAAGGLFE